MIYTEIKKVNEKKVVVTVGKNGEMIRKTSVEVGKEYTVQPLNPNKKKHRDRKVIVRKFLEHQVQVQFLDNKRVGKVEFDELVTQL